MKKDFILPDIGEGIVECELVQWLVQEGDTIKEDQPVCDVMTDKALVQIPAVHDGVVTKLYYGKGEIAKVHAPLFEMQIGAQHSPVTEAPVISSKNTSVALEDFILPDIGEGIVECELVDWLVKEGDVLEEDQPVCDVMTDKALVQIPAKHAGKVVKLYYRKGEIAKVHSALFQQEIVSEQSNPHEGSKSQALSSVPASSTCPLKAAATAQPSLHAQQAPVARTGKALASPAVRRLAKELEIDLSEVIGSGEKGRVYKEDVHAFVSAKQKAPIASDATLAHSGKSQPTGALRREPIKGVKAAMARQMAESVSTIPHFTYCEEIDLTALIALRLELKEAYAKQGIKLTLMPFFMKALSLALTEFPILNSQVNAQCTELTYFDDHNIGIAVDSKVGLLVPNIKGCQQKSILEIAKALTTLTESAREGRVSPSDLKGGTITISNIGAIGGTIATPIINKPEVAIVALGKTQLLPRFNSKGEVEARSLMQVSWSGDHRVIDGGTIARFTNLWKQYLEQPASMLLALR